VGSAGFAAAMRLSDRDARQCFTLRISSASGQSHALPTLHNCSRRWLPTLTVEDKPDIVVDQPKRNRHLQGKDFEVDMKAKSYSHRTSDGTLLLMVESDRVAT
jgi:hypothetical protein